MALSTLGRCGDKGCYGLCRRSCAAIQILSSREGGTGVGLILGQIDLDWRGGLGADCSFWRAFDPLGRVARASDSEDNFGVAGIVFELGA